MTFKYISLFSGIGGFDSALNKLGGQCVFASEIDTHAQTSFKAIYGSENLRGDITKIDAKEIPDHQLIAAGFPCQAFSVSGLRRGFEDARGTLFFEVARIAKEKQPRAILLENVKGLVGHDSGKTLDVIIKTLSDIGYTVDFEVLNSVNYGVPQNRERIFIVAIRNDLINTEEWEITGKNVVQKGKQRIKDLGVRTFNFDYPVSVPLDLTVEDFLEDNPSEAFFISKPIQVKLSAYMSEKGFSLDSNKVTAINKTKQGACYAIITRTQATYLPRHLEKKQATLVYDKGRFRKFTSREVWRLQGFTDEQHDAAEAAGVSDNERHKQAGNAVTVNVISAIGKRLLPFLNGVK